jgi:transcriptional regulator with XRE-family HTH domain
MQKYDGSIYAIPRKSKGFTQEKIAELTAYTVPSVYAFESGQTLPPDEYVLTLITICDCQQLAIQHILNRVSFAKDYVPQVDIKNLSDAILTFQKYINDYLDKQKRFVDIGFDNEVSHNEQQEFDEICTVIERIYASAMAIKLAKYKRAEE